MSVNDSFLPPNWDSIGPQLDRLLDAEPAERAQLLAEITGEDTGRRLALEQLLAECERSLTLLDDTASERFADLARDDDSSGIELPAMLGDRYRLGPELGQGGMARVFLAEDVRHGRSVAVKVIRPELSASLGRGRFLREIEMVARLRHPNIMPLFDSGEAAGVLYYVMPHETGASLKDRLANGPPISLGEGITILRDVARAIVHAHGAGVVHRDIKPANVMLSGGAAVVADFGIGKAITAAREVDGDGHVTSTGAIIGTPAYMAPEQAAGDPGVDHRADLYSFGCLAYAVLTGSPPFAGTPQEVLAGHLGAPPPSLASRRPDLPTPVVRVIEQCLRKPPVERPPDARAVLEVLEGPMTAPKARMRVKPIALGAAGVAVAIALSVWLTDRGGGSVSSGTSSAGLSPVAILPFNNPQKNPAVDYIASALPSHVADQLGVPPNVVPFGTSRDLAAVPDSVRRVSLGQVGVRSVVEGEIHAVGDSVVADVRAVDVGTGRVRFSVRVAAGSMQFAELVHLVTDSLRARFELRQVPVASLHVPNPEAFRLVSEAEHLWRFDTADPRILELYRKASELDPGWYRPFIGLSDYAGIALTGQAGTRSDATRASAAVQYADEALERAGASRAAQSAALIRRALPRYLLGDIDGSRADAQLAASLDSSDFHTQTLIGAWFRWNGQLDSAWKYKARAQRLAPWSAQELVSLASLQRCAGNTTAEVQLMTRAVEMEPQRGSQLLLAEALGTAGRWDEAVAAWERATEPDQVRAMRARAGSIKGEARWRFIRADRARARLEQLRTRNAPRSLSMEWMESFEGVGQRDSAVAILADWIKSGAPKLSFQRFCIHTLDGFRRDPQVQALVRGSTWPLAEFDTAKVWHLSPAVR